MKIYYSKYIKGNGVNLFGIVILNSILQATPIKRRAVINHEGIHTIQMRGLLYIGFYLIYALEFLVYLVIHRDLYKAYRAISFEREAFDNQYHDNIEDYVSTYSWFRIFLN
ncbi:hypothetical protein Molly5_198 [Maribacter phage Molly_5]|uniref:DUF4157 domain-containing protein n=2 Tax=Mollyvirus TaxID=2948826 RepID=A0A8E4UXY9_9CAUD|nr:protease [Maribacter phage Molly_1]YP_010357440.1 protease [Maribacter phage Colly_1]QQO97697.1 hypothetical protein Molly2_198 [Maribacter phage Molly_2]QQO97897.1 hypothetical protein Molly3_198 [Maribacter phage Molly_3]QQO98097.1 hypothetical protein Molly4_198 [Maribacter phage Molly_4]QQO98297.1 hypothetical protein Molly5_198 [Maribacter phage Molly_5]QQO97297.1 hypothetical protein Colly1_191 [Maribacter phage Colly_1]